jgi:phosphoribosylanthranilate isomerase
MVFYPASPRHNSIESARAIARDVPPFVSRVGLFVNPAPADVAAVLSAVPLELLQFHGDETPEFCAGFNRPWVKVARMRPGFDLVEYAARFAAAGASGLVLDAHTEEYGGAGVSFDPCR